jgi:hypothetical protein
VGGREAAWFFHSCSVAISIRVDILLDTVRKGDTEKLERFEFV